MKNNYLVSHISGNWDQMKSIIKRRWSELSIDEINSIKGRKDRLVDTLIDKYELTQEAAEDEVNLFWH